MLTGNPLALLISMAITTDEVRSTLTNLAEVCKDGEEGFRESSEKITRTDLKTLFSEYSAQRAKFAAELQTTIAKLGGEPSQSGTLAGAAHRGWLNLKSMVTGQSDVAIIAEAERGEDVAVKAYRDALSKDVPLEVRDIIQKQSSVVLATHNKVRDLKQNTSHA